VKGEKMADYIPTAGEMLASRLAFAYDTSPAPRTKCDNGDPLPNCSAYATRGFDYDYKTCVCKPKCAADKYWIKSQVRCGTKLQYDAALEEEARIEKERIKCVKMKDHIYVYPTTPGGAGSCPTLDEWKGATGDGGTDGGAGDGGLDTGDLLGSLYECAEDGSQCSPTQTGWIAIGGGVLALGALVFFGMRR
jgi:hypothetical protein